MTADTDFGINAVKEGRATPDQQMEVGRRYHSLMMEKVRLLTELEKVNSRKTPVFITTASDAKCALAKWCFTGNMKPATKQAWLERHDLFLNENRVFALVTTAKEIFYMDCITGSLYALGECMTSPIGRTGFKRNNERGADMLLHWNFEGITGEEDGDL